jgi:hypothetical protein
MKTAISVPDLVFKAADRLAKRRRVSRSQLYTEALVSLLKREGDDEVTARLDMVYGDDSSTLPPELRSLPAAILDKDEW